MLMLFSPSFSLFCALRLSLKDAHKFGDQIRQALRDLLKLLSPSQTEASKTEESQPKVKKEQ